MVRNGGLGGRSGEPGDAGCGGQVNRVGRTSRWGTCFVRAKSAHAWIASAMVNDSRSGVKGQRVEILDFVGHNVSVPTKAATDDS